MYELPNASSSPGLASPDDGLRAKNDAAERGLAHWKEEIHERQATEGRAAQQYIGNLILFLGVVLGTAWFLWLHLNFSLAGVLVFGTPLTLAGLWRLIISWIPEGELLEDRRSVARRVASHRYARRCLWGAVIVVAGLLLTTSSYHLDYGSGTPGGKVEVTVHRDGRPCEQSLAVSAEQPLDRDVAFLSVGQFLSPTRLQFRVVRPEGYALDERRLYPWTSSRIRFPDDFRKKRYYVCRLIPGKGFETLNPATAGETAKSVYDLKIKVGDEEYLLKGGLSVDCFYFGAERSAIQRLIQDEGVTQLHSEIYDYMSVLNPNYLGFNMPWVDLVDRRARLLATRQRFIDTPELQPSATVEISVIHKGSTISQTRLQISEQPGIRSIFLEKQED